MRRHVADYFAKLPSKAAGSTSKLIGLAMGVDGVEDLAIVAARANGTSVLDAAKGELAIAGTPTQLGTLTLVDPALATQVTLQLRYPKDAAIPAQAAIQSALEAALGYLNDLSAQGAPSSPAEQQKRSLSWGKLALITPLPALSPPNLASYDANPGAFSLPTAAQRAPYELRFVFSRPSGVSQVLDGEAAPAFALAAYERLSLAKVSVEVKPKGTGA